MRPCVCHFFVVILQCNLYYCKKFYLLYNQANANLPQVGAELKPTTPGQIVPQVEGKLQDEKLPQLGAEIQALVSAVPWGHHKYIMDYCRNRKCSQRYRCQARR